MTIFAHMHKQEQSFKGSEFSCGRMSFDREIIGSADSEIKGF
jgi:hypothetical protein